MVPQAEHRRFRDGPREIRLAHRGPCWPLACARRVFGTVDEAARREDILDAGATRDRVDLIEQDEAQDLPHAGHRLEPRPRVGVVRCGRFDDVPRESTAPRVRGPKPCSITCHALLHGRIRAPRGDPVAVGCVGQLCPNLGEVIRAVGIVEMREPLGPCPGEGQPAPAQVTGRAPLGRRDLRLREHAPAAQHGTFVRINLLVLGLATVKSFPVERVAEHDRNRLMSAEVSEPIPGNEALDGHDDVVAIRRQRPKEGLWTGLHVLVEQDLPRLVEDADSHGAGVQVDATVPWVWLGVESPEVSSSPERMFPGPSSPTAVCGGGGLNKYQPPAGRRGIASARASLPLFPAPEA
jgi:hypothetical protein